MGLKTKDGVDLEAGQVLHCVTIDRTKEKPYGKTTKIADGYLARYRPKIVGLDDFLDNVYASEENCLSRVSSENQLHESEMKDTNQLRTADGILLKYMNPDDKVYTIECFRSNHMVEANQHIFSEISKHRALKDIWCSQLKAEEKVFETNKLSKSGNKPAKEIIDLAVPQFEYKTFSLQGTMREIDLNRYELEGWNFVSHAALQNSGLINYIFRRPIAALMVAFNAD